MENGIAYLNSLGLHKVKPGLERIKQLLEAFDKPQDKVPTIHIAGTNGKGSVAAAISSILSKEGYRVGLYTSPHLINITERIKINDVQISQTELDSILLELKEAAEKYNIEGSYFEIITAAAFLYFAREKVDFNVLEVGLGGRWDATNVITPLVSVITNISLEHTEYLGETIEEIAAEKAAIIKPGVPVVTAATNNALKVIEEVSNKNSCETLLLGRDFIVTRENLDLYNYNGISMSLTGLKPNLRGHYQQNNIAIAIAAIESLKLNNHISIKEQAVRDGLDNIKWEGRFEIIRENPPLILDSAHNPGAAKSLVESIKEAYPETRFTFLLGMLDDKGHDDFLNTISPITEELIITKVPSDRTANINQLLSLAKNYIKNVEIIEDYKKAYFKLIENDKPSCITGSLYLIGAIKNLIQNP